MLMKYQLGLNAEQVEFDLLNKFNGIGMIRSEYVFRLYDEYITLKSCQEKLFEYIENLCKSTKNDIWYRTSDLIVDEIDVLGGCDHFLLEHDYILGLRGVRRGLKYIDTFVIELSIIAELSKKYDNLNILFSYIKDIDELKRCKKLLKNLGYKNKIGVMAEIPSVIICINDFLESGVNNITIGVNDLTTLVLGTYRTSGYHNINHEAVLAAIKYCKMQCLKYNVQLSVAGVLNKEFIKNCHSMNIDNVIINYSQVHELLDFPLAELPYYTQLNEIKAKTKKQRNLLELELMKKKVKNAKEEYSR